MNKLLLLGLLLLSVFSTAQANDLETTKTLRILSLSPHITETLFALGAGDNVVGVTDYCEFPEAAKAKTKIGSYLNPSVETMVSLEPDIAFFSPGQASIDAQLSAMGIKTVAVPSDSLGDIRQGILLIGSEIGTPKAATQVLAKFDETLANATQSTKPLKPPFPTVLFTLGGPDGGQIFGIGPKTFLDELINRCWAINWLKDAATSYPTVSRESLIASPPQVVIELHTIDPTTPEETQKLQANAEKNWRQILGPRGGNTRVVVIVDKHLTIPGPCMANSVRGLYLAIHPEN